MKPVLLIAINFAREQRWPILTLLVWVLLLAFLGLVTDVHREREDLLFVFKQDAVYVLAFSVFFGGSAIYNERRSRRILGVLSKAVGRQQYLSGLVLGGSARAPGHAPGRNQVRSIAQLGRSTRIGWLGRTNCPG